MWQFDCECVSKSKVFDVFKNKNKSIGLLEYCLLGDELEIIKGLDGFSWNMQILCFKKGVCCKFVFSNYYLIEKINFINKKKN